MLTAAQVQGHYRAGLSTYARTVLGDRPLAYWRLGEPSGTVAVDATGHGYAGTYTNGVTVGQAGALTGTVTWRHKPGSTEKMVWEGTIMMSRRRWRGRNMQRTQ